MAVIGYGCVVRVFGFVCFFSIAVVILPDGAFSNPSSPALDIISYDGSSEVLPKTFYHVHKRSANVANKKAVELDKKTTIKSVHAVLEKDLKTGFTLNKKPIEDSTNSSTAIVVDNSTVGANSPEDKYNASVSSTVSTPSVSTESSPLPPASNSTIPPAVVAGNSTTSESLSPNTTTTTTTTASPITAATDAVTTASQSNTSESLPTMPPGIRNETDHHVYYKSTMILDEKKAMSYQVDFDNLPKDKVVTNLMLSYSHRRAATVTLSFDFPFYGSPVRNITIATGGFLYMGDYMHSWLAATQYVAPLMANFDTRLSNDSTVRYFDNGTAFVIEWNDVSLQEKSVDEKFTFQAILMKSGDIIFVYETIPVSVIEIGDDLHPVKVGLSDAYVIDKMIYFIRRKTIYEYHRIDMKREDISNHTAIYFTALKTCSGFHSCESCMTANISLECVWCETAKRCSDGLDRKRQDWLQQQCDVEKSKIDCSPKTPSDLGPYVQPLTDTVPKTYTTRSTVSSISSNDIMQHPTAPPQQANKAANFKPGQATSFDDSISISAQVIDERRGNFSIGGVVAVLLLVALALGTLAWVGYAYRNPHTSSGQLLIKYRPSQWRFRSGEARYTAASVHM